MKWIISGIVFLLLLIFLVVAMLLFHNVQSALTQKEGMYVLADIPFIDDPEYIVVPVIIDSKKYRFIVDTGSTNTSFDSKLKPLCGDFIKKEKHPFGTQQRELDVEFYRSSKAFKIGFFVLEGEVACIDFSQLVPPGYRCDGIIGMNVFTNKVLQLDIENKRMRLLKKPFFTKTNNSNKNWGDSVQLIIGSSNRPHIYMKLGDIIDEFFMIDTGLRDFNHLRKSSFDKLRLQEKTKTATAKYEDREVNAIGVEVHLSNIEISNMAFVAKPKSILGTHFLKHFKMLTFDFEKNKLYFKLKDTEDVSETTKSD